jgi:hypothetical protein
MGMRCEIHTDPLLRLEAAVIGLVQLALLLF